MGHTTIAEERYTFKPGTKKQLLYLLVAGVVLFGLGLALSMSSGGAASEHEGGHASVATHQLIASAQEDAAAEGHAEAEHEGTAPWLKRVYTTLWMNNIFFVGLGIIGLFFVCIQYAAQAGWSSGVLRIPLAMGHWLPAAFGLTIGLWFVSSHDIFHWTHEYLYDQGNLATYEHRTAFRCSRKCRARDCARPRCRGSRRRGPGPAR